jgi:lysophospholipase L1-like esterase
MKKVFLFGASVVYGVGAVEACWADRIKQAVHRELYGANAKDDACQVFNCGIPGENAAQVNSRIHPALSLSSKPEDKKIIVLSVGTNDSRAEGESTAFQNTPEGYRQTLETMLPAVQRLSSGLICVGFTPVDEHKTLPHRDGNAASYFRNDRIRQFEQVFAEVSLAHHLTFVPLFDKAQAHGWNARLYQDGLHPNDEGHEWMFQQVWPEVRRALGWVSV